LTGEGCWIDSSQAETGIYLTGTTVLGRSVNGDRWRRYGNRSPYKPAAPHGVFRAAGDDRWIAIACFTDAHWSALNATLGTKGLAGDERFSTLDARLQNQDELEALVNEHTEKLDAFELMARLQSAGVPSGVCQTAQDRCDDDPQLAHLGWQVELNQTEIGRWPVKEIPVKFSETPPYIGGIVDRHGPNYGEDNQYVLGELLGLDVAQQEALRADGVI
jgi:crotonobetainyl-CoA:carnitine CoA-transferase CaiB-like acyl-CoA transferase